MILYKGSSFGMGFFNEIVIKHAACEIFHRLFSFRGGFVPASYSIFKLFGYF